MRKIGFVAPVVFAVAAVVRLTAVATSRGGFGGNYGYDAGVYFTAADALTHGRVPYTDFVLLHPPLLMVVLTPFAWLARLVGDHDAFVTANVCFSLLGALNAALVSLVLRAWGLGRRAALVGGLFYAVWLGAAGAEYSARLEPLGTFLFLCGVLTLARGRRNAALIAGVCFGLAVTVKIWWVVPLAVLVLWQAAALRRGRSAVTMLGGAVASTVVVVAPFAALAPSDMWRMVITDQLGRHSGSASIVFRVLSMSSVEDAQSGRSNSVGLVVVVAIVAVVIGALAWRLRAARPIVVVAAAQVTVLLLSPSFFDFYSGYPAAAVCLTAGAAAGRGRVAAAAPVATLLAVAVVTGVVLAGAGARFGPTPMRVGPLRQTVQSVPCVVSDSPMALIALGTLSRDLAAGCPNWVDVTGRTYDADAPVGRYVPRPRNARWQASVLRYLTSGGAVIVIRPGTGLSPATRAAIESLPVLGRSGTLVLYRVP